MANNWILLVVTFPQRYRSYETKTRHRHIFRRKLGVRDNRANGSLGGKNRRGPGTAIHGTCRQVQRKRLESFRFKSAVAGAQVTPNGVLKMLGVTAKKRRLVIDKA